MLATTFKMTTTKHGHTWDTRRRHGFINQREPDLDIPDGDPVRGERIYNVACAGCHQLDDNNWLGPALRNIYNHKFGTKRFFYSKAMYERRGNVWTRERLFMFLEDPESVIPETSMWFDGMKDPFDRACVIEYLHYLRVKTV